MSKKVTVILAKAGWCGHCKDFEPIFEETKNNFKEEKNLNDHDVNFLEYDLATDDGKTNFAISHTNALKMVEGYPTVLVNIYDKNNKNNKYYTIDHTIVKENIKDDSEKNKEASKRFLTNISNLIKSIDSGNKVLYLQKGGDIQNYKTSLDEEIYRKKYLKYKSKYLELKNN